MAQSFHLTSSIADSSPLKPSNCCSDLAVGFEAATFMESAPNEATCTVRSESKKVVVVGAGIAGLRAAAVLHRHGLEVVVLEARNRIGGRILTSRTGNNVRDIGTATIARWRNRPLVKKRTGIVDII